MPNMTGGGSEFERRLVGGAIKFLNITYSGTKYPVLIRYLHSDYPSRAVDAVGFILDREWFTQRVHNVLDSLAKENSQILLMAPPPTDTKENEIYPLEPFSSILGTQTIGVKMGVDTLWWWGDPQVKIRYPYEYPYYPLTAFDMTVGARVKNSWDVVYVWTFRTWTVVLILLELVGCGLLVTLFIGGVSARRQVRRNQIALAHLAHAIKTPIARIRLNVDSLTKEMVASPEEEQGIIAAIDNECQRLERSIHGAAMSLEAGKRTVFPTDGDLRPLIEGVIEGWRPSFANAGVKLLLTADAAVPAKFDPEQIRIVCDNLLDNALRHARLNIGNVPESKVTVSLRTVAGGAEIAVDDTGSGIPKSERKRIFQRFQRVTGSAGTGTSGLGLGLALVKEIVAAHGGSVGIEESKLGGARFVVRLS